MKNPHTYPLTHTIFYRLVTGSFFFGSFFSGILLKTSDIYLIKLLIIKHIIKQYSHNFYLNNTITQQKNTIITFIYTIQS
jgi:hypothetical protein